MNSKIKYLIFDFGGVLVNLNQPRCFQAFANLGLNVTPYLNSYLSEGIFLKMELGEISPKDFWEDVRQLFHAPHLTDQQLTDAWNAMLEEIPRKRLEKMRILRKKYEGIFLLSNTNVLHWEKGKRLFTVEGRNVTDYFDRIFLSCDLHLSKPDIRIFEKVIQKTGIRPEETFFIDDSEANCKAAESLGITTFCPKNGDDWLALFND